MGTTTVVCALPNLNRDVIRGFISTATKEGEFVVDVNSEGIRSRVYQYSLNLSKITFYERNYQCL